MDSTKLTEFKTFIDQCKSDSYSSLLSTPSLSFFRDYLEREAAQAKGKAMEAISEGNFDEAIEHLTRAITLNPTSAILYGNQATVYIKLNKPNAAIRDANAALEINPDSAKGYKSRGMARAMLGEWAGAAKDLHLASTIDYDEEISVVLKKAAYDKAKKEEQSSSSRPFSIFQVS